MKIYDKEQFYEKIKNFFKLNWWLVWVSNLAIVAVIIYVSLSTFKQNEEIKELLKQEIQGVVFLGANGQAIFGEKQLINAGSDTAFKDAIKNNLIQHLITDTQRITKNYTATEEITADYIYKNYLPIRECGDNFMFRGNDRYPNSFGFFRTFLVGLSQSIAANNLPDQIIPIDSVIQTYIWKDETQTFEIIVNIAVNALIYNSALNTYDKKAGTIQIRARGFFDMAQNSVINPLGLKYYEIGITNVSTKQ